MRDPFSASRLWCVALAALVGCGDAVGPKSPALVTLRLTDAPGDFVEAVVTIGEIYLQGGGSSGRVFLRDEPVTVDLMELQNATVDLLTGVEVEAGSYQQLRFVVSGAYIRAEAEEGTQVYASPGYDKVPDGTEVDGTLIMPSFDASGLKVDLAGPLELSGGPVTLLVDFDVSQSFGRQAGQSGNWVMQPVIKGATVEEAGTVVVTLTSGAGLTLPAGVTLGSFSAVLDGEEVAFTDGDGNGTFDATFLFVLPGTYKLTLELPAEVSAVATDPAMPAEGLDVTVAGGATVTIALTLTAVTPAP